MKRTGNLQNESIGHDTIRFLQLFFIETKITVKISGSAL